MNASTMSGRRWFVRRGVAWVAGALATGPQLAFSAPALSDRPLPDVELVDQDGRTQSLRALGQRPLVIAFFYTGCSSICPPLTASLRELHGRLQGTGGSGVPLILSISVDPLGDSPQALRDYARRFGLHLGRDQGWLMLTGEATTLIKVWRAFDVPTSTVDAHPSTLWLRRGPAERWTRANVLTDPGRLVSILLAHREPR